jgi:serine/threonine-protein kinase
MICPSCGSVNSDSAEVCFSCVRALGPATRTLMRGSILLSRYEIRSPLGKGGMGMVFRAHDLVLDEDVALKTLLPDVSQEPDVARRFVSEIRLAHRVRHPNVCSIHEYGEERGLRFIAMELVEGMDLRRLLRERGGLSPAQAFDVVIQAAEGLRAIHEAGIIHRDLKTANIMVDVGGTVRLMDFGIAKESSSDVTLGGSIIGTPEYMSPEQAYGRKVDFRCDIYALGVVAYELFTGNVPFHGDTPIATILMHLNDPPPLDGPQADAIPPALKEVLRRALAKSPAERHASAAEMLAALEDARAAWERQDAEASAASPHVLASLVDDPTPGGIGIITSAAVPKTHFPATKVRPSATAVTMLAPTLAPARSSPLGAVWLWAWCSRALRPTLAYLRLAREPPGRLTAALRVQPAVAAVGLVGAVVAVLVWAAVAPGRRPAPPPKVRSPPPASMPPVWQAGPSAAPAPPSTPLPSRRARVETRPATPRRSAGAADRQTPAAVAPSPASPSPIEGIVPVEESSAALQRAEETTPLASPPPERGQVPDAVSRVFDLSEVTTLPVPDAANPQPIYPPAPEAGEGGDVLLKIVVSSEGSVSQVIVLSGAEPFSEAAVTAVRRWRFEPALLDGRPVPVGLALRIPFLPRRRLPDQSPAAVPSPPSNR